MAEPLFPLQDQATGVQPFLYPLPPTADASPALQLLLLPFKAVLGSIRILLVLLLLLAQALIVEGLLRVFVRPPAAPPLNRADKGLPQDFVPGGYAAVTRSINASICRLILAVIGVVWINVETVQLRKTGYVPPERSNVGPVRNADRTLAFAQPEPASSSLRPEEGGRDCRQLVLLPGSPLPRLPVSSLSHSQSCFSRHSDPDVLPSTSATTPR